MDKIDIYTGSTILQWNCEASQPIMHVPSRGACNIHNRTLIKLWK